MLCVSTRRVLYWERTLKIFDSVCYINISSGAGRVATKSYLAEVELDVSMRSEAGMGVFWVEESMQSDEPGVCSSSSIFVSVSGCF